MIKDLTRDGIATSPGKRHRQQKS